MPAEATAYTTNLVNALFS